MDLRKIKSIIELSSNDILSCNSFAERIDMICRFACCKYSIKQGSIINIKGSNIAYVSPHIITIKENNYLIFNGSDNVFINDYSKCIKLKDMEVHIKNN